MRRRLYEVPASRLSAGRPLPCRALRGRTSGSVRRDLLLLLAPWLAVCTALLGSASSLKPTGRVLVHLAMLSTASGWQIPSQESQESQESKIAAKVEGARDRRKLASNCNGSWYATRCHPHSLLRNGTGPLNVALFCARSDGFFGGDCDANCNENCPACESGKYQNGTHECDSDGAQLHEGTCAPCRDCESECEVSACQAGGEETDRTCAPCPQSGPSFANDGSLGTAVQMWVNDRATALSTYGPISGWDVSAITDMGGLFEGLDAFNEDISSWDTSSVTNMYGMFHVCPPARTMAPGPSVHAAFTASAPTPSRPARLACRPPCASV